MRAPSLFDKIDLHLIRVLHTVLTERSVSRATIHLRDFSGDPLLVHSGAGMVASTLLVLTTGRQYCSRFVDALPVVLLLCPIEFLRMMYYQLWHERTYVSAPGQWLRERVKSVAASLKRN